jgi:hypothetical protein
MDEIIAADSAVDIVAAEDPDPSIYGGDFYFL